MLGIIGAMEEEVSAMKELLCNVEIKTIAGMDFCKGNMDGRDVVIVRSGIGKVNAGICVQILADRYQVSAIINTGIAGSLQAEINIGDIVLSKDALQHDVDVSIFGYELGVIPRMKNSVFPGDERLIKLALECCHKVCGGIDTHVGRILSGDQFISNKEKKDWLIQQFHGYCTEMEGAAIAQAAYLNQIPFLIIRAISDKADDSANMDYPEFEAMAIKNSVNLLTEFIKQYTY